MINRMHSETSTVSRQGRREQGRESRGEAILSLNDLVTIFHFLIEYGLV